MSESQTPPRTHREIVFAAIETLKKELPTLAPKAKALHATVHIEAPAGSPAVYDGAILGKASDYVGRSDDFQAYARGKVKCALNAHIDSEELANQPALMHHGYCLYKGGVWRYGCIAIGISGATEDEDHAIAGRLADLIQEGFVRLYKYWRQIGTPLVPGTISAQ